jgi:RNA 2',3'-cyclic 3'-phosphodiesterase
MKQSRVLRSLASGSRPRRTVVGHVAVAGVLRARGPHWSPPSRVSRSPPSGLRHRPHCCVRLFVAVPLPPAVMQKLEDLERPALFRVRWTTASQWHVTLRFLGEVASPDPVAEALQSVPSRLRAAGVTSLMATLGPAVAWFPGRRVLQVPVEGLEELAEAVEQTTAAWGGPAEEGGFRGHVTLARVRGTRPGPAALAGAELRAHWPVDAFSLMSSTPAPGGSRYEALTTVSLSGDVLSGGAG